MEEEKVYEETSDSPLRWNPPMPSGFKEYEELVDADVIKGTAFSKQWLFTVLMKLIQEVDKQNESGNTENEFGVDVDEDLQDELCNLWDMSMNSDVVVFMREFKSVELLSAVIANSRAPRVTEICVGILGNLACNETVCREMSADQNFIHMVLLLLQNPDGLCLVQTFRLLYSCLGYEAGQSAWISAIKQQENEILEQIKFIMTSSTNVELLKNTGELVNILMDLDDVLCRRWSEASLLTSMFEAIKEIGYEPCPALEIYIHNFQLMSCTEKGAEALDSMSVQLQKLLMKYLIYLCDEPIVAVDIKAKYLAAVLSLISLIFLQNSKFDINAFYKGDMLPKCLLKILEALFPYIFHAVKILTPNKVPNRRHSVSVIEDLATFKKYRWDKDVSECEEALVILYSSLQAAVANFLWLIPETAVEDSVWSQILHYLDTECAELHLHYLVMIIQDLSHEVKSPVEYLKVVSDSNGLYRLHHIVVDSISHQMNKEPTSRHQKTKSSIT